MPKKNISYSYSKFGITNDIFPKLKVPKRRLKDRRLESVRPSAYIFLLPASFDHNSITTIMCSIFLCFETTPRKSQDLVEATVSFSFNFTVRLVHAGGKEELYRYAIPASDVMQKYPGMCIATPEVFKRPHVSVLSAEDELSPGHKYYLVPTTTVKKLKLKWLKRKKEGRLRRIDEGSDIKSTEISDTSEDISLESVGSAKAFYHRNCIFEKESAMKQKKPFVPPIQKPRLLRGRKGYEWEPGLPSIEEISP